MQNTRIKELGVEHEGTKIEQRQKRCSGRWTPTTDSRYLSMVRACGILTMADIATEFQTLLNVTMLPPRDQDDTAHAALRSPSSG